MTRRCVFCTIVGEDPENQIIRRHFGTVVFGPLNPVTEGHLLIVPTTHVPHALANPRITARTMAVAAREGRRARDRDDVDINLITNVGPNATQTVRHLHVHVIPRRHGDGLHLPWTAREAT